MGQCCTSTPPEHRIQSNTQPLPREKKQLIDNPNTQTKKTDVGQEQRNHQIVPDDTCTDEETDDQQNNITTPKQQIKNKPIEIGSIDTNPINHIISTNNNGLNHSNDDIHMPSPQQTIEKILQKQTPGWTSTDININDNDNDNNDMKQEQLLTDTNNKRCAINNEQFDEIMGDTISNVESVANRQKNIITELDKLNFLLDKIEDRISNIVDADLIDEDYDSDEPIAPLNHPKDSDDSEDEHAHLINKQASLHQTETAGQLMVTDDDSNSD